MARCASRHGFADSPRCRRRDSGAVSRSSLIQGQAGHERWYDVDAFLLDQVCEVLDKLYDGSIDDEIWGKIVIMERCKRVAKAYLRKTTVIIDGSEEEFDGKTLGFNYFVNPERDEHIEEIRMKIGDGVILKMDLQGNVKGMARGTAPVICQGWRSERSGCVADRLIRQQGRLNSTTNEEEKAYKMFDMRKFKHALDRELHESMPDAKSLLLKTCVRVALVKDGVDMMRTPCWFAIVNIVALDMLKEKIPNLRSLVQSRTAEQEDYRCTSSALTQDALTQIIAAAVTQVNKGLSKSMQTLPVTQEQIAQLASTLNLTTIGRNDNTMTLNKKERSRRPYHSSTSSLDSSGEDSHPPRSIETTLMKAPRAKRYDNPRNQDDLYDSGLDKTRERDKRSRHMPTRPRLSDVLFTRSHSITSDYDSNKEHFDSGSWSSTNSREYKTVRSSLAPLDQPAPLAETIVIPDEQDRGAERVGDADSGAWKRLTDDVHVDDTSTTTNTSTPVTTATNTSTKGARVETTTFTANQVEKKPAVIYDEPPHEDEEEDRAPDHPPPPVPDEPSADATEITLAPMFCRGAARRWKAANAPPRRLTHSFRSSDRSCVIGATSSVSPAANTTSAATAATASSLASSGVSSAAARPLGSAPAAVPLPQPQSALLHLQPGHRADCAEQLPFSPSSTSPQLDTTDCNESLAQRRYHGPGSSSPGVAAPCDAADARVVAQV